MDTSHLYRQQAVVSFVTKSSQKIQQHVASITNELSYLSGKLKEVLNFIKFPWIPQKPNKYLKPRQSHGYQRFMSLTDVYTALLITRLHTHLINSRAQAFTTEPPAPQSLDDKLGNAQCSNNLQ